MHCVPFLLTALCSLFLTVSAPFSDVCRIPADLFLSFLPIFPHRSAESCISCLLCTRKLPSTKAHRRLSARKEKRIEKFTSFLNTQGGKIRSLHLHKNRRVISCSYFCIEYNALCSARTSSKISSLPSLCTCSAKNVRFWINDCLYTKHDSF